MKSPPIGRILVGGSLLGWILVAAVSYLRYPVTAATDDLGWLLIVAVCWAGALIATALTIVRWLTSRAYAKAAAAAVIAIAAGGTTWTVDWSTAYLDSQFRLHRGALHDLATSFEAGRLTADERLPLEIRYLSRDGRAHLQPSDARRPAAQNPRVLYLPVWEDWRGEAGAGLAYLGGHPPAEVVIATALGGMGVPSRHVGDGWWWVAGG